ncbi:MAG: hypothetical protein INH41_21440 [Myxococcaceae bacterium]|nr:hypothetical protein [Myxococcaceae bacterium]MCA3014959.1 hypothetical protein [Myxococcaceae bacterium]
MSARAPGGLLAALLCASPAAAHPEGFHVRAVFTLTKTAVTGLVVMDVDSGERCELLRAGADANHDGALSAPERRALEQRLAAMALRGLKVAISSYPVPLRRADTRLSLRGDGAVSRAGLSVALLLEANHPYAVSPGMHFDVEAVTPDGSALRLEVLQAADPSERAPEPAFSSEVASGRRTRVRLGLLGAGGPVPDGGARGP